MIIESAGISDRGLVRPDNEDAILRFEFSVREKGEKRFAGLYAVADGLGGYDGGEVASGTAVAALARSIIGQVNSFDSPAEGLISDILRDAVKAANKAVLECGSCRSLHMGTTLATVLIVGTTAYIANIGDSRVYLLRQGSLSQLTRDHSLVADLVIEGLISSEEAYSHPQRNIITRCLGGMEELTVDLLVKEVEAGDTWLLCSDGLWEMVRNPEIQRGLDEGTPQAACKRLVVSANQNGGIDNVSTIVVKATW